MRSLIVSMLIVGLLGCGTRTKLKGSPVSVSGKVSQGNQPIGGMVMIFQPLGDGHVREFSIRKDGTFNGELVSGEYAYYIAKPTVSGAGPRKLPPQYFEANLSRTVSVEPDKLLAITLD